MTITIFHAPTPADVITRDEADHLARQIETWHRRYLECSAQLKEAHAVIQQQCRTIDELADRMYEAGKV